MKVIYKFGLISHVLKKLGEKRWYYGKIVIQKIIYFLQEAENVDMGYAFTFYHYGPYSEELTRDIQLMEINDIIKSTMDPRGMGYAIHLDRDKAEEYIEKSSNYIRNKEEKIKKVIENFGKFKPAPLELYSTIHFVYKELRSNFQGPALKNAVVRSVISMKPQFTISKIKNSYDRLQELDYIP